MIKPSKGDEVSKGEQMPLKLMIKPSSRLLY
jgi:hypothetical protein